MNLLVGILTFSVMVGIGLLVLRPAMMMRVDQYEVRLRPRKQKLVESAAQAPKDDKLLKLCKGIGEVALGTLPALADKRTMTLLKYANYRTQDHLAIFIGIKVLIVIGCVIVSILYAANNPICILFSPVLALGGWQTANFFLAARGAKRQKEILREMPTVIDLLIVCAQAGLGLLMCIDKVSKEIELSCPVLSAELKQLITDVKVFAKATSQSLQDMGDRNGVDELSSVAAALIAAESKGSDISYPLKQQSEALRDRLKRKKEEEASKVPVKMVPVIMIFVMPLILCPMLGPAVIAILAGLQPMMSGGK